MAERAGLILAAIGAAAGALYLLDRANQGRPGGGPAGAASGLAVDPGGGTALAVPNPLTNFPLYYAGTVAGAGGTPPSPTTTSSPTATAGASSAPAAGQAATFKAVSTSATIASRNTSGATSVYGPAGADLSPSLSQLAGIAARAPQGGPNISSRVQPGSLLGAAPLTVAAAAQVVAGSADYSTAAHIRPGLSTGIGTGSAGLTPAAAAQVVALSANYSSAAHYRPTTPTAVLAAAAAAAKAAQFRAILAQPHPSIATRSTYKPPPPPPRPAPGRSSGTQTL